MKGKIIQELNIGDEAVCRRTISESDVYQFAGITGDQNPAHIDAVYAEGTRFGARIAHGILTSGLISAVIGMQLPGPGTIYLEQSLRFTAPVYIGDTIEAKVTVAELIAEKNIVKLETTCTNQNGKTVITGQATVMPPK